MSEDNGATFMGVHRSGRELVLDTDLSPRKLEDNILGTLFERPEAPIFRFHQSGKEYPMFINLNHFSYCEVNPKGDRTTESGILVPNAPNIVGLKPMKRV